MILQKVFGPSTIKIGLESENKEELFEELVDHLSKTFPAGTRFPRAEVIQALEAREAKMSTGIVKGIALPHAKVEGIACLKGVLGISRSGIDYDSLDGHPVYLVFMLLAPLGGSEFHLQALQRLALLIADKEFVQRLSTASSPEEAQAVLAEFEKNEDA
ncbi:MAG: PTS sugar transporter subunit IIA [Spirochaetes bacterium]|nr:PTS sugar transporter subunit IIA [Spirochaetota bacterium]